MSAGNDIRGEIGIDLGGTEYVLRPSYEAVAAIERKTGRGLLALARTAGEGDLTLAETAIIAAECIRAHGKSIGDNMLAATSSERIAELVLESNDGVAGVMGRMAIMLGLAATGGYDKAGELKPAKVSQQATD